MALRLGVATTLLALVLPTAAAASVFHGTFHWDAPARLHADLTIGLERTVEARASLPPTTPTPTVLLESPHARLRLLRWTHAAVAPLDLKGSVGSRLPDSSYQATAYDAHEATLRLVELREAPEVVHEAHAPSLVPPGAAWSAPAASCTLEAAAPGPSGRYPNDPAADPRAGHPWGIARPGTLHATCTVGPVEMPGLTRILYYGLTLALSSREGNRTFKTGTFVEPNPTTGLPERVTQLVEALPAETPLLARLPAAPRFEILAPSIAGAGRFELPSGFGRFRWDAWTQDGPMEPLPLEGAFVAAGGPDREVSLEAVTYEGAPGTNAVDASASGLPAGTHAALAWVAGVAGVGLLLRALWSLLVGRRVEPLAAHPRRARILELADRRPGLTVQALARALGLPWPKAYYHVATLRRAGLLSLRRVGARTAVFPRAGPWRGREQSWSLLARATMRRAYDELENSPGLDRATLADRLGVTPQAISYSLRRLESAGLVHWDRRVGRKRFFAVGGALFAQVRGPPIEGAPPKPEA